MDAEGGEAGAAGQRVADRGRDAGVAAEGRRGDVEQDQPGGGGAQLREQRLEREIARDGVDHRDLVPLAAQQRRGGEERDRDHVVLERRETLLAAPLADVADPLERRGVEQQDLHGRAPGRRGAGLHLDAPARRRAPPRRAPARRPHRTRNRDEAHHQHREAVEEGGPGAVVVDAHGVVVADAQPLQRGDDGDLLGAAVLPPGEVAQDERQAAHPEEAEARLDVPVGEPGERARERRSGSGCPRPCSAGRARSPARRAGRRGPAPRSPRPPPVSPPPGAGRRRRG